MLEKSDVINALNIRSSGNGRNSNQLTWNYIFHVNNSYEMSVLCYKFIEMLKYQTVVHAVCN